MILESSEARPLWRIYVLLLGIVVGLGVVVLCMAYRQLVQGDHWSDQLAQSSTRAMKIPAPRGRIVDRNGVVLVDNRPSYNVALFLDEFGAGRNRKKLLKAVRGSVETLRTRMKMPVSVNDD